MSWRPSNRAKLSRTQVIGAQVCDSRPRYYYCSWCTPPAQCAWGWPFFLIKRGQCTGGVAAQRRWNPETMRTNPPSLTCKPQPPLQMRTDAVLIHIWAWGALKICNIVFLTWFPYQHKIYLQYIPFRIFLNLASLQYFDELNQSNVFKCEGKIIIHYNLCLYWERPVK